jgi:UDP-N-acetylmuramoylalanine--D-glutamate ligase
MTDEFTIEKLLTSNIAVLGCGVAGFGAAVGLLGSPRFHGQVRVLDSGDGPQIQQRAEILAQLGGVISLNFDDESLPECDVLVVSPGISLDHHLIVDARLRGVLVWGELELAWRLREITASADAPWLVVTGTNGKTTTTLMLQSMLNAAGLRSLAVGNIGISIVDAILDPEGFDVLAVETSAQQLAFVESMSPHASVVLNLAADHLDYFESFDAYRETKAKAFRNTQIAAMWNDNDDDTLHMLEAADVVEGCRAIGITLGIPAPSMLGIVEDMLVDRAFLDERASHAVPLAHITDISPMVPHNVFNALAAAALARSIGVSASAVAMGLQNFVPAEHRIAHVAEIDGVAWIDDSKATNCHAAAASLQAYDPVVWLAGGLTKGQDFSDLIARHAHRLRAVVLFGTDREVIAASMAEIAPSVPVRVVSAATGREAMADVVAEAAALAKPGDTVLLAPACSSWDFFAGGYAERGDAFAHAVAALRDGVAQ